jgi:hypothetical protein
LPNALRTCSARSSTFAALSVASSATGLAARHTIGYASSTLGWGSPC